MMEARNISIISNRFIFNYFVIFTILKNNLNACKTVEQTKRELATKMGFKPVRANTINLSFSDCGTIFQTKKESEGYKNKAKI